jgi:peptidoglycan/LPS O-acetylase OafA/YrhL
MTLAPSDQLRSLRGDGLASLFYVANWRFVLSGQSYFALFTVPSPMRHLWSLAIEEQFYLVWPLVVLVSMRAGRGKRTLLTGVCVAGIATSVAVMALLYEPADPSRAYYGTDARAHTILVGALLAIFVARFRPRSRGATTSVHLLGLLAAAACLWAWVRVGDQSSRLYHGGSLLFALAVAAVILSAVRPERAPLRAFLSLGVLRWIGMVSYGLYLWHWPAVVVLTETRTGLSGAPLATARLAATVGAATLSFYLVEQPIRRGALRGWRARVAVPTGLATAGVLLVVTTAGASAASPLAGVQVGQRLGAASEPTSVTKIGARASTSSPRILLVGDSVPYTLLPGLQPAAARRGVTLGTALVAGCGVVSGVATYFDGKVPPQAQDCEKLVNTYERESLASDHPQLVVWMSMWEIYDRFENGQLVRFGSPEWDRMMLAKIDEAVTRLTSGGAHLVIATMAPRSPNELVPPSDAQETSRYLRLDDLYRQYARAHPSTTSVIDFAHIVCPGGPPCPRTVDGVDPRPQDGLHFTPQTAQWAAPRLLDAVLACRPSSLGWTCPETATRPRTQSGRK